MLLAFLISASAMPPAKELGLPVFVDEESGVCAYGVQDMITRDEAKLSEWMRTYFDHAPRIDIVVNLSSPKRCIDSAESIVRKAGFTNVVVRQGSIDEYDVGPPRP